MCFKDVQKLLRNTFLEVTFHWSILATFSPHFFIWKVEKKYTCFWYTKVLAFKLRGDFGPVTYTIKELFSLDCLCCPGLTFYLDMLFHLHIALITENCFLNWSKIYFLVSNSCSYILDKEWVNSSFYKKIMWIFESS